MSRSDDLLMQVARQHHILKGEQEADGEWQTRLIYSICGMMAYASLWDDSAELASNESGHLKTVSVVHLKRRVGSVLAAYQALYLALAVSLPANAEALANEIEQIFTAAGVIYHRPYRVAPAARREAPCAGIILQRGIALDDISRVSGLGFYAVAAGHDGAASPDTDAARAMFGLESKPLPELWQRIVAAATWRTPDDDFETASDTEYLRLKPPFSNGYWGSKPERSGSVAMLRSGKPGTHLYYLYRYRDEVLEVSQLPQWQVENSNYRTLACACLADRGTLPPLEYCEDGALVHIRLGYLLPPRELAFLKYYSWPETCSSLPCDFKRKLSAEVFAVVKNLLSQAGYSFQEEMF